MVFSNLSHNTTIDRHIEWREVMLGVTIEEFVSGCDTTFDDIVEDTYKHMPTVCVDMRLSKEQNVYNYLNSRMILREVEPMFNSNT